MSSAENAELVELGEQGCHILRDGAGTRKKNTPQRIADALMAYGRDYTPRLGCNVGPVPPFLFTNFHSR